MRLSHSGRVSVPLIRTPCQTQPHSTQLNCLTLVSDFYGIRLVAVSRVNLITDEVRSIGPVFRMGQHARWLIIERAKTPSVHVEDLFRLPLLLYCVAEFSDDTPSRIRGNLMLNGIATNAFLYVLMSIALLSGSARDRAATYASSATARHKHT